jgi:alkylation response protein AidB-like acyl-CoA dehydrogenase
MTSESPTATTDEALESFRERVRTWLAAAAPANGWVRDESRSASAARPSAGDASAIERYLTRARECQQQLYEAGFAGIGWPREYGGQGLTNREQVVFNEESQAYDLPLIPYTIGLGMCGPTVLAVGTDAQKQRYIVPMLRGEEIWCQMFSEPGAGSDVAGLQTRAEPVEDGWRVNGQKVWTSGAQYCRWGMLLARTNSEVPKHRGLTMFIVDMAASGVTVRPLRQMNGASGFNEVFFDDVILPSDAALGGIDDGWRTSLVTLMNERVAIGAGRPTGEIPTAASLVALAGRDGPVAEDIADAIAAVYVQERVLGLLSNRINAAIMQDRPPGPEGSVAKLVATDLARRAASLAAQIAGPSAQAWREDDPAADHWAAVLLMTPGLSIAGGTDEIMRNILGERALGLPREPRVDTGPAGRTAS